MSCNTRAKLDVQGHRGCRGLYPENSIPAFKKAIELGVTTLELDIVISKDKKVVVSHEPYMNPTICYDSLGKPIPKEAGKTFNLYSLNYDEIEQFDCGTKFHPKYPNQKKLKTYKPLLSDVFQLVKDLNADVGFNIEIKSDVSYYGKYTPQPKEYVSIVLEDIKNFGAVQNVNLQSFDINILEEVKAQDPNMPVALLIDENESIIQKLELLSFKPEIISPYFKLLNKETFSRLKKDGFYVIPWTINEEKDMTAMIELGIDGIITDYPDLLLNLLQNQSY